MLEAILFDLDDTLLHTDTEDFIARYFAKLGQYLKPHGDAPQILRAIMIATEKMVHEKHPSLTNFESFSLEFDRESAVPASVIWPHMQVFYRDIYPSLGDGLEPVPGAKMAVMEAKAKGLKVVVATNPLFPLGAIATRLSWAGLSVHDFDFVTGLENVHYCKPLVEYYQEVAEVIGVLPGRCLMVGNDPEQDVKPAQEAGMWTYQAITDGIPVVAEADAFGTMMEFLHLLRESNLPGMRGKIGDQSRV